MEQDRPLPPVALLQLSDHRVACAHAHEVVSVVVERDDPGNLGHGRVGIGALGERQLDRHRAVGLRLAQDRAGVAAAAVDREGQPHRAVVAQRPTRVGPKAELRGSLERERSSRRDLQRGHGRRPRALSAW
jgi:hypothetical protein